MNNLSFMTVAYLLLTTFLSPAQGETLITDELVFTSVIKSRCQTCHESTKYPFNNVDVLMNESKSKAICVSVLSNEENSLMAKMSNFKSWGIEEKNNFRKWCKNKGWNPESELSLDDKINKIYDKQCVHCHITKADPWITPTNFCQTVYNRSMPWMQHDPKGKIINVSLIDEWSSSEKSDFKKWCLDKVSKKEIIELIFKSK